MKWNKNNVTTERGNWRPLIAKFNNSDFWFTTDYMGWTGSYIATFRRIGKLIGATNIEVKYMYDDKDEIVESAKNIIQVVEFYDGSVKFRQELDVPAGSKREFKYYELGNLIK